MNAQTNKIQKLSAYNKQIASYTARFKSSAELQNYLLQGVSRTFALTIPQLPGALRSVVSNAYLLCRIIDTIEDESELNFEQKKQFSNTFITVVEEQSSAQAFCDQLAPLLSTATIPEEHELIKLTPDVIQITHGFSTAQKKALSWCVRSMAEGMIEFQKPPDTVDSAIGNNVDNSVDNNVGLDDQIQMDRYCYYVAGVVGEMLTELFCEYSTQIAQHRECLLKLSVSFGQGLQMTNILKDIWDDRKRGACWLPRSVFNEFDYDLNQLLTLQPLDSDALTFKNKEHFEQALGQLIGVAHGHLINALHYTLLIPKDEHGIRKFCLWAIGMAMLTLRKINKNRCYIASNQVKISKRSVKATILVSNLSVGHDRLLKFLFNLSSRGLPLTKCKLSDI